MAQNSINPIHTGIFSSSPRQNWLLKACSHNPPFPANLPLHVINHGISTIFLPLERIWIHFGGFSMIGGSPGGHFPKHKDHLLTHAPLSLFSSDILPPPCFILFSFFILLYQRLLCLLFPRSTIELIINSGQKWGAKSSFVCSKNKWTVANSYIDNHRDRRR